MVNSGKMSNKLENPEDSIINRGLNIRNINLELSKAFHKYAMVLNRIMGGEMFNASSQMRKLKQVDGLSIPEFKGAVKVKNGVDKFQYLMRHTQKVASDLGLNRNDIYRNRRDFGKISEVLRKMDVLFDLGDVNQEMQLYISKQDNNVSSLDNEDMWVDYIMAPDWLSRLSESTLDNANVSTDHRLAYLSDMIQGMMKDHEIDFHGQLESINFTEYMDKGGKDNRYQDTVNKLTLFRKLNCPIYELFKPIGGSTEKYIKVMVESNGMVEVSGVVGPSDCEHVEWEYGSKEYLRSLNTGNQMYEFKLSRPFNDLDSVLWWKPDDKEELPDQEDVEEESKKYQYYKPYETERFLRWFGSTHVPYLDVGHVVKKTICSIPVISNDTQRRNFFADANNLMVPDLQGKNVDERTSLSLLSLSQKSTLDIVEKSDGQYLRFVVSGNQGTSNLAFKVRAKMLPEIEEINHYCHTLNVIFSGYCTLSKRIMFLQETSRLNPPLEKDIWGKLMPNDEYLPQEWIAVHDALREIVELPTSIDLIRFRMLDYEAMFKGLDDQFNARREFLRSLVGRKDVDKDLERTMHGFKFWDENLEICIFNWEERKTNSYVMVAYNSLSMTKSERQDLSEKLNALEETMLELKDAGAISWETTVDIIRERIQTFNNLIVRLPADPTTNKFTLRSKHIWQDWKEFVDGSLDWLVKEGKLYVLHEPTSEFASTFQEQEKLFVGWGTDGKDYRFLEHYVDAGTKIPLIDYSYCMEKISETEYRAKKDDKGNYIGDRWEAWSESDFMDRS